MIEINYNPTSATTLVHPLEYELTLSVQKDGTFDHFTRDVGSISLKVKTIPQMMLTAFPVTEDTYPRLYRIFEKVQKRLDCIESIPLYVDFGYELKARTYGSAKSGYIILVNSACVKELNDAELTALLGREIGHIMNDHIHYQELMDSIHLITDRLSVAGDMAQKKVSSFFSKWLIASEYTADRAGLIACQSFESLATLLMRQMGIKPCVKNIQKILTQKVDTMPDKMGINYMIMARAFPSIGMVSRLKEIDKWVNSAKFRDAYPYIHYMAKGYVQMATLNETEKTLVFLHQRASNGNVVAQERLAKDYLLGEETLPVAFEPCLALLYSASFLGSGKAMYLFYNVLEREIGGLKASQRLKNQLIMAAKSRTAVAQKVMAKTPDMEILEALSSIVRKFTIQRYNNLSCKVNITQPGNPVSNEVAEEVLDAFWMTADDRIYATQFEMETGSRFGIALSEKGIFGRIKGKKYPFMISWAEFAQKPLEVRSDGKRDFVMCGEMKIAVWNGKIDVGSINELLIILKKNI